MGFCFEPDPQSGLAPSHLRHPLFEDLVFSPPIWREANETTNQFART